MMLTMFVLAMVLMAASGIYCLVATRNLIRMLIALEIVNKAATLLFALAGSLNGQMALAESYIIALIIVEVVVTAVGAALSIAIYARTGSLDINSLFDGKEGSDAN